MPGPDASADRWPAAGVSPPPHRATRPLRDAGVQNGRQAPGVAALVRTTPGGYGGHEIIRADRCRSLVQDDTRKPVPSVGLSGINLPADGVIVAGPEGRRRAPSGETTTSPPPSHPGATPRGRLARTAAALAGLTAASAP